MAKVTFDESGPLDLELLKKLKTARPLPEFPFGCATPIICCDFGTGESKTVWVDHDGNEI